METTGNSTPDCDCHGVPMLWKKDVKLASQGRWICRIISREQNRARYHKRDGRSYNALLLRHRRNKALKRKTGRLSRVLDKPIGAPQNGADG